ncbi:MAG TPA: hypothetical protein VGE10_11270 [Zeimonas sp.]
MKNWPEAMRDGMVSGALAAATTVGMLALRGRREDGSAAAPLNAVSHVYWGDRALRQDGTSVRYTGAGLATHVVSALLWGVLYEKLLGERSPRPLARLVCDTAAASAAIAAVDFGFVPDRLTPGFQHRLSTASLLGVYVALGLGLAAGTRWSSSRSQRDASHSPIAR